MFSWMFTHCSVSFYNLHTLSKDHPKNTMPEGAKLITYLRVEHLKNHTHIAYKLYGSIPPPRGTGHLT